MRVEKPGFINLFNKKLRLPPAYCTFIVYDALLLLLLCVLGVYLCGKELSGMQGEKQVRDSYDMTCSTADIGGQRIS